MREEYMKLCIFVMCMQSEDDRETLFYLVNFKSIFRFLIYYFFFHVKKKLHPNFGSEFL